MPQRTYKSDCSGALCLAREVFGERVGLQLLFMLGKYGFNGSHFRMKNADAWTSEELEQILEALSDLPPHLASRPAGAMNHPLVHFTRNDTSTGRPLGNAVIYLFNGWNEQTPEVRRYVVFHELGHNVEFDFRLDEQGAWSKVAGWSENDFDWAMKDPTSKISHYAENNPDEDFAESFAAYRYAPEELRRRSPKVYRFMKDKVFRGREYTNETSCRSP